jgi:hypothetical protein
MKAPICNKLKSLALHSEVLGLGNNLQWNLQWKITVEITLEICMPPPPPQPHGLKFCAFTVKWRHPSAISCKAWHGSQKFRGWAIIYSGNYSGNLHAPPTSPTTRRQILPSHYNIKALICNKLQSLA